MNDELFDWDDANILHLAEHDVIPEEAEEVILGEPVEMSYDKSDLGEDRWSYLGETSGRRILQVVITPRGNKVRIVTAFEPIRRYKLLYWKSKAGLL
jgi:uncharacterized protein